MSKSFGKIVVTGGCGHLGTVIMRELAAIGAPVAFDMKPPREDVPFISGSVLALADLEAALVGADALVHVAAIPNPRDRPAEIVFDTNVRGTWHAFHAALRAGVRKAILISSECATGLCYQQGEFPPEYLPVDEHYPLQPTEVYGLSKKLAEGVAESFARPSPKGERMDVTVIRPLFILFDHNHKEIAERGGLFHRDVWGWVEPHDVAVAVRLALQKVEGFEVFFAGAPNTIATETTLGLVQQRFGRLPEIRRPALYQENPHAAIFDIAKAERLLGYAPSGDWRRHLISGTAD